MALTDPPRPSMRRLHFVLLVTLALMPPSIARSQTTPPGSAHAARALHALFDAHTAWRSKESPEWAMSRGDYSRADQVTDDSLAAIERRQREALEFIDQIKAIDPAGLGEVDRVSYELFLLELSQRAQGQRFRTFLMPIGGRSGPQQSVPQMAERVRFNSADDYLNYLKRLEQVPVMIDRVIERLRLGMSEGRTVPQVTLAGLPGQFDAVLGGGLNALREPIDRMPDSISKEQHARIAQRFDRESLAAVRQAMQRLRDFVVNQYLPACRQTIAARDLPDGEAYYEHQLRTYTTTSMAPREIHELGLREVARIKAEMLDVIRSSDFLGQSPASREFENDNERLFDAFINYLRSDPRFYHTSEESLLIGYRDICKRVDAWLPRLFKTLPRLPYGVREIPEYMAPTQTTAYYQHGDIRNAEPGWFAANTYALDQRPRYEMIPLALHEAVPGHHLQIALAQEIEGLPEFRKDSYFIAFGEGWALYAERLGIEMGFYKDPYDNFGRLLYEMWRACRLVVDPGMHALGWSRQRAVEFMRANTALSELNIKTEIDRYINWPGQATAYKIGELKIRELRARAEKALGARFDLREFHEVVLGAGSVPLPVLERRVNAWIGDSPSPAGSGSVGK